MWITLEQMRKRICKAAERVEIKESMAEPSAELQKVFKNGFGTNVNAVMLIKLHGIENFKL